MAGRLTWQNVAAPDFSASSRTQANAADLLDRAFSSGINAIDNFQNAPIEREGAMLRNELAGQQINTLKNEQATREKMNLAAPILNQMATLSAAGDLEGTLNLARANPEIINSLDPKFVSDFFTNKQNLVSKNDNIINTRDAKNLEASKRLDDVSMKNAVANVLISSGGDPAATTVNALEIAKTLPKNLQGAFLLQVQNTVKGAFGADIDFTGYGNATPQEQVPTGMPSQTTQPQQVQAEPSANSGGNKFKYVPVEGLSGSQWAKSGGLYTSESGGNYQAKNDVVGSGGKKGHFGALQFGHDRLTDAKRAGVIPADMTPEQFRNSDEKVQDAVADWHFADIDKQAARMGLDQAFGTVIKGVVISPESIRGMAHLGGMGGVRDFIRTNGEKDPADANGTRLSTYGKRFGKSPESNQQVAQQPASIPFMAAQNQPGQPIGALSGQFSPAAAAAAQLTAQASQGQQGNVSKQPAQQGFRSASDLLAAINMPGYEATAQAGVTERVAQVSDPLLAGAEEWMTDDKYTLNQAGKDLAEEFKSFGKNDAYWQSAVRKIQGEFKDARGRPLNPKAITEVLKNSKADIGSLRQLINEKGVLDSRVSEALDQLGSNDFAKVTAERKTVLALDRERKKLTSEVLAAQERYRQAARQAQVIPSRANQARAAEEALQRSLNKLMKVTDDINSIPVGNRNKQTAKEESNQFAESVRSALGLPQGGLFQFGSR